MSTLKLGESGSSLEIFPGSSTLENEIQKLLDLEMPVKSSVLYLNYYFKNALIIHEEIKIEKKYIINQCLYTVIKISLDLHKL